MISPPPPKKKKKKKKKKGGREGWSGKVKIPKKSYVKKKKKKEKMYGIWQPSAAVCPVAH